MIIDTLRFAGALKSVLPAVGKDKERPAHMTVQMHHVGDQLKLSATDGAWCLMWQDAVTDAGNARTVLPVSEARFLLTVLEHSGCADVEVDVGAATFQSTNGKFSLQLDRSDMDPPDLDKQFAKRENGSVQAIVVDPAKFRDAGKAFAAASGSSPAPFVEAIFGPTPQSPILLTCDKCPELTALVMPCEYPEEEDDRQRTLEGMEA